MAVARIYKPARTAMQSGTANTKEWVLEFEPEQARELYGKAFVKINLNTGKREEFLLIPRVGSRMAAELMEYRPWKTWAQFDKEIGKYVGQQEVDRLKQYVLLPPA